MEKKPLQLRKVNQQLVQLAIAFLKQPKNWNFPRMYEKQIIFIFNLPGKRRLGSAKEGKEELDLKLSNRVLPPKTTRGCPLYPGRNRRT